MLSFYTKYLRISLMYSALCVVLLSAHSALNAMDLVTANLAPVSHNSSEQPSILSHQEQAIDHPPVLLQPNAAEPIPVDYAVATTSGLIQQQIELFQEYAGQFGEDYNNCAVQSQPIPLINITSAQLQKLLPLMEQIAKRQQENKQEELRCNNLDPINAAQLSSAADYLDIPAVQKYLIEYFGKACGEYIKNNQPKSGQDVCDMFDHLSLNKINPVIKLAVANYMQQADVFQPVFEHVLPLLTRVLGEHAESVECVAWSPDGTQLASCSRDKTVCIWDIAGNKEPQKLSGHADTVNAIAWSPCSKRMASCDDTTVRVWDVQDGRALHVFKGCKCFAWSPCGRYIAIGFRNNALQVWDVAGNKGLCTLIGHTSCVDYIAWSPCGKYVASSSQHYNFSESLKAYDSIIRVWDVADNKELCVLKGDLCWHENPIAWSPCSTYLASFSHDHAAHVWDIHGNELCVLGRHERCANYSIAWLLCGKSLATSSNDGTIRIWDIERANEKKAIKNPRSNCWLGPILCFRDQYVARCSDNGTMCVCNVTSNQEAAMFSGHIKNVYCVDWSLCGRYFAGGSYDNKIRIWSSPLYFTDKLSLEQVLLLVALQKARKEGRLELFKQEVQGLSELAEYMHSLPDELKRAYEIPVNLSEEQSIVAAQPAVTRIGRYIAHGFVLAAAYALYEYLSS